MAESSQKSGKRIDPPSEPALRKRADDLDERTRLSLDPLGLQGTSATGSSRKAVASKGSSVRGESSIAAAEVALEDQKTVISKRPPLAESLPPHPNTSGEVGQLLVGKTLGHFQLEQFVGGGGMGAVFQAHDTLLARRVAVKVLARDAADEETIRRFKNEAQSSARLDHAHIARVFHVGEEDGWNYIVFEFVDGQNIRDLVAAEGPLSFDACVSLTLQIAESLEHASQRDVIHRDIKPSNVIVGKDGRAKLVDMGLARLHQVESSNHDLTASGVTLGTFDYISPEQARDPRSADVRSDLYSLGCTLYFMLTGRPPFPDGTVLQKLLSHSSDAVPDPRQIRPETPAELAAILRKLTAKQPNERYQEPAELIGELLLLSSKLGLRCAQRGGTVWITPPEARLKAWERHLPWLAPVAILLLAVLAIDLFFPPRSALNTANRVPATGDDHLPVATKGGKGRANTGPFVATGSAAAATKPGAANATKTNAPGDGKSAASSADDQGGKTASGDSGARGGSSAGDPVPAKPNEVPIALTSNGSGKPIENAPAVASDSGGFGPPPLHGELVASTLLSTGELLAPMAAELREGVAGKNVPFAVDHAPAVLEAVERVIVDPSGAASGDPKELVVATLEEGLRRSNQLSAVNAIVLRFSGPRLANPIAIMNRRLTLRAGKGFSPELVFRPSVSERRETRGQMVRLYGGEINFEGINFRVELPREPADEWSVFGLADVRSIRLLNCMLTISNHGAGRSAFHPHVAFFQVESQAVKGGLRMNDHVPVVPLAIDLWHTAARGEATLVRAEEIRPVRFYWGNGVFVSTERMIELGGSRTPVAADEHVRIDLSHVTAACDKGLLLVTSDDAAPHQMPVNLRCHDSIFICRERPLVEQQGISLEQLKGNLLVSGSGNFYHETGVFWKLTERTPSTRTEVFDFNEWSRQWPNEKLPQRDVQWRTELSALAERPVSRHLTSDYVLSENPSNPAATSAENRTPAGFQDELLPEFPSSQEPPQPMLVPKPEVEQPANLR